MLAETVPSDVYHSCAYYENPDVDMEKKGWLGADLVFDIDADHIPTNCDKIHDEFTCVKCGFSGKGLIPEICPCCEKQQNLNPKPGLVNFVYNPPGMKPQSFRYVGERFRFFPNDSTCVFFRPRGYHVHIENEKVRLSMQWHKKKSWIM